MRTLTNLCRDRPPVDITDNDALRAVAAHMSHRRGAALAAVTTFGCGSCSRVGVSPAPRVSSETAQGGLAPLIRTGGAGTESLLFLCEPQLVWKETPP